MLGVGGNGAPLLLPVNWRGRGPDLASGGGAQARGAMVFGVGRRGGDHGDTRRRGGGL
jgi:hypothetical protein